uniref:Deoxynucleotidyltransferase terminal-interacting protein 1 n=1 Tax=Phallusia mammillata TaxID=59560 RepID=A0A6F9DB46_9ASCI|nr:deoxynucleotidyltransferase terminal-interacting protein 1-like [Phallusia mammillata]
MVDAFVPQGHCSKTFWDQEPHPYNEVVKLCKEPKQPYSIYHLEQPHNIRVKHGHIGASPACRANVSSSMDLLRQVLQPTINCDIVEVFQKYITVFREAAENAKSNMAREPFKSAHVNVDVEEMVFRACQMALDSAKSLFVPKESKEKKQPAGIVTQKTSTTKGSILSFRPPIHSHLMAGKRRAASPDLPWERRLKAESRDMLSRRSLSPIPKKRPRNTTPIPGQRGYGSPHRNPKDAVRKKIEESWDPARLTTETEFVMGTKANRALGLGATRGRIYMKHPDLFKYAGDHEDKKWMVKHNCMAATGGKNTFIMIAEDVLHLFKTEYKDSPGTLSEELQFFKLPDFVLRKMQASMINEKRLRLGGKFAKTGSPTVTPRKEPTVPIVTIKPIKPPLGLSQLASPEITRRLRERTPDVPKPDDSDSESDDIGKHSDGSSSYAETD